MVKRCGLVLCMKWWSLIDAAWLALLAWVAGAGERPFIKKRISYTNKPLGDIEVVPDFLPLPAELAFRQQGA